MLRIIKKDINTKIMSTDEKGAGGAYHRYTIESSNPHLGEQYAEVNFQKGAIYENKLNGCQNEDLIAICIDRLQCFQAGDFGCRENAIAITKLQEAMMWLEFRTKQRVERGVEGKSVK